MSRIKSIMLTYEGDAKATFAVVEYVDGTQEVLMGHEKVFGLNGESVIFETDLDVDLDKGDLYENNV